MPNTREKLIELLEDTRNNAAWHHWGYEESADHLIANGVRLEEKQATSDESKWIPVTERLPEEYKAVFVCYESGKVYINYTTRGGKWHSIGDDITHWMPLPEPPKGV